MRMAAPECETFVPTPSFPCPFAPLGCSNSLALQERFVRIVRRFRSSCRASRAILSTAVLRVLSFISRRSFVDLEFRPRRVGACSPIFRCCVKLVYRISEIVGAPISFVNTESPLRRVCKRLPPEIPRCPASEGSEPADRCRVLLIGRIRLSKWRII